MRNRLIYFPRSIFRREQHEMGEERRTLECEVCGFVSKGGIRNLRKHMTTHSKDRPRKAREQQHTFDHGFLHASTFSQA